MNPPIHLSFLADTEEQVFSVLTCANIPRARGRVLSCAIDLVVSLHKYNMANAFDDEQRELCQLWKKAHERKTHSPCLVCTRVYRASRKANEHEHMEDFDTVSYFSHVMKVVRVPFRGRVFCNHVMFRIERFYVCFRDCRISKEAL